MTKKLPNFQSNSVAVFGREKGTLVFQSVKAQFLLRDELLKAGFVEDKDFLMGIDGIAYSEKVASLLSGNCYLDHFIKCSQALRKANS